MFIIYNYRQESACALENPWHVTLTTSSLQRFSRRSNSKGILINQFQLCCPNMDWPMLMTGLKLSLYLGSSILANHFVLMQPNIMSKKDEAKTNFRYPWVLLKIDHLVATYINVYKAEANNKYIDTFIWRVDIYFRGGINSCFIQKFDICFRLSFVRLSAENYGIHSPEIQGAKSKKIRRIQSGYLKINKKRRLYWKKSIHL